MSNENENEIETHILFTNISMVKFGSVNLHCHALVLSKGGVGGMRLRGFETEACTEIFSVRLDGAAHVLRDATPDMYINDVRYHHNGHRIYTQYKLCVGDMVLELHTDDSEFELDAQVIAGPREERPICEVWKALARKTEHYWTAPAMPMAISVTPEERLSVQRRLMPGLHR